MNKWQETVKRVAKQHPGKSLREILPLAKAVYKKMGHVATKVRKTSKGRKGRKGRKSMKGGCGGSGCNTVNGNISSDGIGSSGSSGGVVPSNEDDYVNYASSGGSKRRRRGSKRRRRGSKRK